MADKRNGDAPRSAKRDTWVTVQGKGYRSPGMCEEIVRCSMFVCRLSSVVALRAIFSSLIPPLRGATRLLQTRRDSDGTRVRWK
jgi:hypothetical protein